MRPLWQATHAVVDKAEADPEFARFIHASAEKYKRADFSEYAEDKPIEIVYRRTVHPEWTIRIVTNWDRSRTTISFSWEELDDEQ